MNKRLIELYFQIEKEMADDSKEKAQINEIAGKLVKKFGGKPAEKCGNDSPVDKMRKLKFAQFLNEKIYSLPKNRSDKITRDEEKETFMKETLKIIEETLGEELKTAKDIREKLSIKNIVKKYIQE